MEYFIPVWFSFTYNNPLANTSSLLNKEKRIKGKNPVLLTYPDSGGLFIQHCILSRDFKISQENQWAMERANAKIGQATGGRVFFLLWKNKDIKVSYGQENLWNRGNSNEVVVCMSLSDNGDLQWCRTFGLSGVSEAIEIRQDIISMGKFDLYKAIGFAEKNMVTYIPANMKKYDYLKPDISWWKVLIIVVVSIGTTVGAIWFVVLNDVFGV
jgi:hypothetical protein